MAAGQLQISQITPMLGTRAGTLMAYISSSGSAPDVAGGVLRQVPDRDETQAAEVPQQRHRGRPRQAQAIDPPPCAGCRTWTTAYATIKGFDVMRALRKDQAPIFATQRGIVGAARIVERAFGVGPRALTEAHGIATRPSGQRRFLRRTPVLPDHLTPSPSLQQSHRCQSFPSDSSDPRPGCATLRRARFRSLSARPGRSRRHTTSVSPARRWSSASRKPSRSAETRLRQ